MPAPCEGSQAGTWKADLDRIVAVLADRPSSARQRALYSVTDEVLSSVAIARTFG